MPSEKQWIGHLFERLIAQPKVAFPRKGDAVTASKRPGVYIIRRGRKVLHVGRTVRGSQGLCQRVRNHLHGNSSFTVNYRGGYAKRLRQGGHTYQWLVVEKGRNRALLEYYATVPTTSDWERQCSRNRFRECSASRVPDFRR